MGAKTGIEWTDSSWNPLRGCSRVSEGCRNCYAEGMAARFSGDDQPYNGLAVMQNGKPHWTGKVEFVEEHLLDPLRWRGIVEHRPECKETGQRALCGCLPRGRRIFVNSMSDLFHPNVPDEWIDQIFSVMALCPQHTFQVLTKRPERMLAYARRVADSKPHEPVNQAVFDGINAIIGGFSTWPLQNVWLGTSVENQSAADERIPLLLQTPAAVRFISAEPLIGSLKIRPYLGIECVHGDSYSEDDTNATICRECEDTPVLDWVIVGGESGPGARPMHPDWARSLRDQCRDAGVPFFFKQWGEWCPSESLDTILLDEGTIHEGYGPIKTIAWAGRGKSLNTPGIRLDRVGKHAAGSLLDGVSWKQFPGVTP